MASDDGKKDGDRTEASHGPRECMPCRGTGRVISNLGGAPSTLPCPWCRGGGVRLAGIDAQAQGHGEQTGAGSSAHGGPPGASA